MTNRTRYFVIVSLLVLGVGLGTGLVAYYVGFPAGALGRRGGPDELELVPRDATVSRFRYPGNSSTAGSQPKAKTSPTTSGRLSRVPTSAKTAP